jgi:hypothetical protein
VAVAQGHTRGKAGKKFGRRKFRALVEKDLHQIVSAAAAFRRAATVEAALSTSASSSDRCGDGEPLLAAVGISLAMIAAVSPRNAATRTPRFQCHRGRLDMRHRVEKMFDADIGRAISQGDIASIIAAGEHRFINQDGTGAVAAAIAALLHGQFAGRRKLGRCRDPRLRCSKIEILTPVSHHVVSHRQCHPQLGQILTVAG